MQRWLDSPASLHRSAPHLSRYLVLASILLVLRFGLSSNNWAINVPSGVRTSFVILTVGELTRLLTGDLDASSWARTSLCENPHRQKNAL